MGESRSLTEALRVFEAAEANLSRLEKLLAELEQMQPDGIVFGGVTGYEQKVRAYGAILEALPPIEGWKPEETPREPDMMSKVRLDAQEVGEPEAFLTAEEWIDEPGVQLREYRFRFDQKRRDLVRSAVQDLVEDIDGSLRKLGPLLEGEPDMASRAPEEEWIELQEKVREIHVLLGRSVGRPKRWKELVRHLSFGQLQDLSDILRLDWPEVRAGLSDGLYAEDEPVPVPVNDLADVVKAHPTGRVPARLGWEKLDDDGFERVIFALIDGEDQYENVAWLTKTRAPDRGRDLSADRVRIDSLTGTERQRVIIQCRHWLERSIGPDDVSALRDRMSLWEPPTVDVLVIATSGRFTSDAVALVERHNVTGSHPRIEMWPESHLERLLATRPGIVGQFSLR